MLTPLEALSLRIDKLETQKNQAALTLIEILSNATFFGELKKSNCQYAVDGQCGLFIFENDAINKIPIITECRIPQCQESSRHYHIEPSNITCTLCEKIYIELQSSSLPKKITDNHGAHRESLKEIKEE